MYTKAKANFFNEVICMYKLLKTEGRAKRGEFHTVHGTIQTPVFMNVGTAAAIKGGISSIDLADQLKCQIELCNTYHLHLRPGDEKIKVIKTVRELTGLGLKEAKDLVDNAPKPIKEGLPKEECEKIVAMFKEVGATIEVK